MVRDDGESNAKGREETLGASNSASGPGCRTWISTNLSAIRHPLFSVSGNQSHHRFRRSNCLSLLVPTSCRTPSWPSSSWMIRASAVSNQGENMTREKSLVAKGQKKNVGKHRRYPNSGGQIHNSFDPPMFDEVKWSETSVTRKGPWRVQAWRKRRKLGTTTLTFCIFTRTRTESFAMFHRCLKNTTNKIAPWKRERLLSKHEISRIMTSNGKRQTVLRKGPTNDLRHLRCKHPFCACFGAWFGSRFFCCEMAGSNAHLFAQWLGL